MDAADLKNIRMANSGSARLGTAATSMAFPVITKAHTRADSSECREAVDVVLSLAVRASRSAAAVRAMAIPTVAP